MKTYCVCIGGEKVGSVNVERAGLYYQFFCQCHLSGEVMFDLIVSSPNGEVRLGLLSPEKGQFVLKKSVPMKQFGEGEWEFRLRPRHASVADRFVPIRAEEPFAYLSRLENAVLEMRKGQIGVVLKIEK